MNRYEQRRAASLQNPRVAAGYREMDAELVSGEQGVHCVRSAVVPTAGADGSGASAPVVDQSK